MALPRQIYVVDILPSASAETTVFDTPNRLADTKPAHPLSSRDAELIAAQRLRCEIFSVGSAEGA
jgi:hypothetical protein